MLTPLGDKLLPGVLLLQGGPLSIAPAFSLLAAEVTVVASDAAEVLLDEEEDDEFELLLFPV